MFKAKVRVQKRSIKNSYTVDAGEFEDELEAWDAARAKAREVAGEVLAKHPTWRIVPSVTFYREDGSWRICFPPEVKGIHAMPVRGQIRATTNAIVGLTQIRGS